MPPPSKSPNGLSQVAGLAARSAKVNDTGKEERQRPYITFLVVSLKPIPDYEDGPNSTGTFDDVLATYRAVIRQIVADYNVSVKMLEPDTVLTIFKAPRRPTHNMQQAVRAAFTIMDQLVQLNRRQLARERAPLRIGIGIHQGLVPMKMNQKQRATALAQSVAKAEGLSFLNQQTPFPAVFVSESTLDGLKGCHEYYIQRLGEVILDRQVKETPVYAVMPVRSI